MISPTFKLSGLNGVIKSLERADKQIRFAVAKSLTQTAKAVQSDMTAEMKKQFDRPTPYTLRSSFVKPATRFNLTAVVGIKDMSPSKAAASPAELLGHQFLGGRRIRKNLENYLAKAGFLSSGEFVVPGAGARFDQFGNMSRGQVQQIISQLHLGLDPYSWASKSRRSQQNVKKAGRIFWSRGSARSAHLPRGAWIDMGGSVGIRPLLIVVKRPSYRQRIDFDKAAAASIKRHWDRIFEAALAHAFATAR